MTKDTDIAALREQLAAAEAAQRAPLAEIVKQIDALDGALDADDKVGEQVKALRTLARVIGNRIGRAE